MNASQRLAWVLVACACVWAGVRASEPAPVTGYVVIVAPGEPNGNKPITGVADASDVVVWLTSVDGAIPTTQPPKPARAPQMIQRNKTFEPHVLVVQVGTAVEFPNEDPFFHNIFSLFDGKRFDLGLYEAGSTRSVRFDREGVSFLFCNIHPGMSAVVVAVDTPYFGISNRAGRWTIANVPAGRYEMHVWYERGLPEDLKRLTRTIVISDSDSDSDRSLGRMRITENPNFTPAHKNMYGQDYVPPPSSYVP